MVFVAMYFNVKELNFDFGVWRIQFLAEKVSLERVPMKEVTNQKLRARLCYLLAIQTSRYMYYLRDRIMYDGEVVGNFFFSS